MELKQTRQPASDSASRPAEPAAAARLPWLTLISGSWGAQMNPPFIYGSWDFTRPSRGVGDPGVKQGTDVSGASLCPSSWPLIGLPLRSPQRRARSH